MAGRHELKPTQFARLEGLWGEEEVSSLGKWVYIYIISNSLFQWSTSFKTNKRSNGQERDVTPQTIYGIKSKLTLVIYTLILSHMPNIRVLTQAILKIFG